jgi:hypothetical protein
MSSKGGSPSDSALGGASIMGFSISSLTPGNLGVELSEMSNKASESSDLSDVAEASELVREVAPVQGATIRERILFAARKLGWRYSRTRDVWYEQARRIDAGEMDQLRRTMDARKLQEATNEYRDLRARIARIEAALLASDEDFHRPQIDALQQSLRGLGGVAGAGTDGDDE